MRTLPPSAAVARALPCYLLSALGLWVTAGCGPKNQPADSTQVIPPTTAAAYPGYPPGSAPPPPGYPAPQTQQQPPPGYPPAPAATYSQYPQQAPPAPTAPPQTAPPPVPPPAASGQMAVPGPIATPCQNDVPCLTHRCNVQYGKCAFPCQSAVDCIAPNQCIAGVCMPSAPPAH